MLRRPPSRLVAPGRSRRRSRPRRLLGNRGSRGRSRGPLGSDPAPPPAYLAHSRPLPSAGEPMRRDVCLAPRRRRERRRRPTLPHGRDGPAPLPRPPLGGELPRLPPRLPRPNSVRPRRQRGRGSRFDHERRRQARPPPKRAPRWKPAVRPPSPFLLHLSTPARGRGPTGRQGGPVAGGGRPAQVGRL